MQRSAQCVGLVEWWLHIQQCIQQQYGQQHTASEDRWMPCECINHQGLASLNCSSSSSRGSRHAGDSNSDSGGDRHSSQLLQPRFHISTPSSPCSAPLRHNVMYKHPAPICTCLSAAAPHHPLLFLSHNAFAVSLPCSSTHRTLCLCAT